MNYFVISPYYPQNFQQFTIELANKGITVLGIGQEPYEQLDEPLRNSLTEYFRVDNMENWDEVKRAVAFLFYKHGPIDRIESHNEYWLELDAALREQFNVFGAKPKDLKKTKFKSEMKKLFKKAGVPVVPGAVVKAEKDIDKAVKKIGLPLIAKPDNGVGAAATFKLETAEDVDHFKAEWDGHTVYNYAHSIDLYRGYAAIVAGEPFPASEFEPLYCLATSRRANAAYVLSEEEVLAKYQDQFRVKKDMPSAFAELQGDYLYMLTTPSREELEQMIHDFGQRQS